MLKVIQRKKGFTLIEVVITIALVAGISTLVFVSFNSLTDKQVLTKQIDFLKSGIVKVRNDAINAKNGSDQSIVFATSTVAYDGNIYELSSGVTLASYTLSNKAVTFSRLTGFPNATGTLIYQLKRGDTVLSTSSITINNLGIIE